MTGRPRVAAILLAAGFSRRMGAENKLLLDVNGAPMVRSIAKTILESKIDSLTIVLGHQAAAVGAVIRDLPASTIVNENYALGQMSSKGTTQA